MCLNSSSYTWSVLYSVPIFLELVPFRSTQLWNGTCSVPFHEPLNWNSFCSSSVPRSSKTVKFQIVPANTTFPSYFQLNFLQFHCRLAQLSIFCTLLLVISSCCTKVLDLNAYTSVILHSQKVWIYKNFHITHHWLIDKPKKWRMKRKIKQIYVELQVPERN